METKQSLVRVHPKGELKIPAKPTPLPIPIDTFGGRIHVEWNPQSAVTPLGQLPFFIDFLKTADLFDPWVKDCPLSYASPNAPSKRDILGTLFLSILAGHWRYAHMTSIRCDTVNPELLGMQKVVSEDSVRRGLRNIPETSEEEWLHKHLERCYLPLLYEPWILDIDTTVKPLYGKQEGAVLGYNPEKPGRPSHVYHTYFVANIRLALEVEVQPGNKTAAQYSRPGLWSLLKRLPKSAWPEFIRGDNAWGNEEAMKECEGQSVDYLFKLRQTKNVKRLVEQVFQRGLWVSAGQGWEGIESELMLQGWSRKRRVVVIRRLLKGDLACKKEDKKRGQLTFGIVAFEKGVQKYEYAVLVTSLSDEIMTIAQHYRDRADVENNFDELKNQWSWGGYTTRDLKRCRIVARATALIYNWWSLFVRLAIPNRHAEAITSRPLLLHAIGKKTEHGGQTTVTITSTHAKTSTVQKILRSLANFLKKIRTAEQLSWEEKWRRILSRVFVYFLRGKLLRPPPLLTQPA